MSDSLLQKLIEYNGSKTPFHMPGHKRATKNSLLPYSIDITEVEGFDNLHDMQGVLKDIATLGKSIYKSLMSFPLVNGSTCGILAGLYALSRENKNILIARNCHKSVYNAVEILGLNPFYILPEMTEIGTFGAISPQKTEQYIKEYNIGIVVITSPTYDGVISDISEIYNICKKHGVYLFVDSAHGAHLTDACKNCDLCVVSLHKTLPALTQTAMLNVYSECVNLDILKHGLSIFETSSPSYILLASIDECMRYMKNHPESLKVLEDRLLSFYKNVSTLKNIRVTHFDDLGKIIITASDGYLLMEMLREENIELEMASEKYALAMATVMDTDESLEKLSSALFKIDKFFSFCADVESMKIPLPEKSMNISDTVNIKGEFYDIKKAEGKISLEYIWSYPPGIPILAPGEIISSEIIEYLSAKKDLKSTKGTFPKIYTMYENEE